MPNHFRVETITSLISQAEPMYYKLVLLVAPSGSGKTAVLREVSQREGLRYVNVNLELSRKLLGEEVRQRYRRAQRLLEEILSTGAPGAVLLDNIEMLFEPSLRLNVLNCLKQLARHRVVVAAWSGVRENGLIYASPEHLREFQRYGVENDVLIVNP